jgi:hypothetical protein
MLITMLQSFIRICSYSKYVIYLKSIDFQGLLHCFSGIITLLFRDYYCTWILFRDYYVAIQGLLLYLDSFQPIVNQK